MKKVLVVGATGLTGGLVVRDLLGRDAEVSALVRDSSTEPARSLAGAGARLIAGDLRNAASLKAACAGQEVVVTTATSMPTGADDGLRRVDMEGTLALIEAAEKAGARRFVYTSFSGNINIDSPLQQAKRACEQRLLSGTMAAEILRPSFFMEVWLGPHLGVDVASGKARVCGSGEAKESYVSLADVAAFAAAAAMRTDSGKRVVEIGGTEALSQNEAIARLAKLAGKKIERDFLPEEAIRAQYETASDPLQKTFAALMLAYTEGDEIADAASSAAAYGVNLMSLEAAMKKMSAAHG